MYTKNFFHLDVISTSRVEGSHYSLKSWILNCKRSIAEVVKHINTLLFIQYNSIKTEILTSVNNSIIGLQDQPFFNQLDKKNSKKCFSILYNQYLLINSSNAQYSECNISLINSLGLPCHHSMKILKENEINLTTDFLSPFWNLELIEPKISQFKFKLTC
jgi:hypothetical protein